MISPNLGVDLAVKINMARNIKKKAVGGVPERLLDTDTTHVVEVMVRGVASALTSERIFPRAQRAKKI